MDSSDPNQRLFNLQLGQEIHSLPIFNLSLHARMIPSKKKRLAVVNLDEWMCHLGNLELCTSTTNYNLANLLVRLSRLLFNSILGKYVEHCRWPQFVRRCIELLLMTWNVYVPVCFTNVSPLHPQTLPKPYFPTYSDFEKTKSAIHIQILLVIHRTHSIPLSLGPQYTYIKIHIFVHVCFCFVCFIYTHILSTQA